MFEENYSVIEEAKPEDNTHKVLFLDPETLEVVSSYYISPPFVLGIDSLVTANANFKGINLSYIVVDKDYSGLISQEMLTDFQREIAYKLLENGYSKQQALLMGASSSYDEYSQKEIDLKRRYFDVKQQIGTSEAPFLLNLDLIE
jgi:hypothetical protein